MCKFWMLTAMVVAVMSVLVVATHGQSLGDVARQQRAKENVRTSHAKVVTDEDIPSHPEVESSEKNEDASNQNDETSAGPETSSESVNQKAEQWRARIQAQKNNVAALQSQVDRQNASIHFVEANAYSNGVQYNQHQLRKQQEARQMQKQLDEQKKKLEDMQDAARREGFGSKIFDP
jgi:hypothetical protein